MSEQTSIVTDNYGGNASCHKIDAGCKHHAYLLSFAFNSLCRGHSNARLYLDSVMYSQMAVHYFQCIHRDLSTVSKIKLNTALRNSHLVCCIFLWLTVVSYI